MHPRCAYIQRFGPLAGAEWALLLAGAVLLCHISLDRLLGYGLRYESGFADTHLGRIGRAGAA